MAFSYIRMHQPIILQPTMQPAQLVICCGVQLTVQKQLYSVILVVFDVIQLDDNWI